MGIFSKIFLLYAKDMRLEARSRITLISVLFFSFLLLLIFNFGFPAVSSNADAYAPGVLWIVFSFSGVLALSRIFEHEKERWAIKGVLLAKVEPQAIYLAKLLVHLSMMLIIEVVTIILFIVLFNPQWTPVLSLRIFLASATATVGFSAVGVIVTSMLFNERLKDLLLPLLFYPLVIPLVILTVKSVESLIATGDMPLWKYLAGFDIIFVVASYMLYDYVLEGN